MTWHQLFQNPLLAENPVVKKWVKTVLEHQSTLERAAGGKLGEVLGCGHWGCVLDMPKTPWVLKLTVDPTEAHIWSKILGLIEAEHYGDDGFPRFKKLFKLEPGIPYGRTGRTRIAYGIVREKVAPVFSHNRFGLELTDYSKKHLGLGKLKVKIPTRAAPGWKEVPAPVLYRRLVNKELEGLDARTQNKVDEFVANIEAVAKYQHLAQRWHGTGPPLLYAGMTRNELQGWIKKALNHMGGGIGGPLGESLNMLLSNGVVLNDVHQLNIGWRFLTEVEGIEGYPCLVVFDPGHTPTKKRQLPTEHWRQLAALG